MKRKLIWDEWVSEDEDDGADCAGIKETPIGQIEGVVVPSDDLLKRKTVEMDSDGDEIKGKRSKNDECHELMAMATEIANTEIANPKIESDSKMNLEEIMKIPRFRNYVRGEPSKTLYVKNLDPRKVQESDLSRLFLPFVNTPASASSAPAPTLPIRLMREGRMKGQAFIKFSSVEDASQALESVIGTVLHGKPIIIASHLLFLSSLSKSNNHLLILCYSNSVKQIKDLRLY